MLVATASGVQRYCIIAARPALTALSGCSQHKKLRFVGVISTKQSALACGGGREIKLRTRRSLQCRPALHDWQQTFPGVAAAAINQAESPEGLTEWLAGWLAHIVQLVESTARCDALPDRRKSTGGRHCDRGMMVVSVISKHRSVAVAWGLGCLI